MHPAICRSVRAGVTHAMAAGSSAANANGFLPATYAEVITVSGPGRPYSGQPGWRAPATCRADQDDAFADFCTTAATSTRPGSAPSPPNLLAAEKVALEVAVDLGKCR